MKYAFLVATLFLIGCGRPTGAPVITLHDEPLEFSVYGEGDLRATTATLLTIPGEQLAPRQVEWMVSDGSLVRKGDLVARFSSGQGKQDLAQASIDLERNGLARVSKLGELNIKSEKLGLDLEQVTGQQAVAHRYANATILAMARNDILDAVQDERYLNVRRGVVEWRLDQSARRGQAELAVVDAQRKILQGKVLQKQSDLGALELRAPSDGYLVLARDWSDQLPHVGSNLWAGSAFASIPNLPDSEVQLAVPQIDAQGVQIGDTVYVNPLGSPAQGIIGKLTWIAAAAQTRNPESPVKYVVMKVGLPKGAVAKYGWMPGQRFVGRIILLRTKGLAVPNMAISYKGGDPSVAVLTRGHIATRAVQLGVRGSSRSQVLSGLKAGDQIVVDDGALKDSK